MLSLPPCCPVEISHCVSLYLSLFLCPSLCVRLSLSALCLSLSAWLSLDREYVCHSLSVSQCLFVCPYLYLSVPPPLSLSPLTVLPQSLLLNALFLIPFHMLLSIGLDVNVASCMPFMSGSKSVANAPATQRHEFKSPVEFKLCKSSWISKRCWLLVKMQPCHNVTLVRHP